MTPKALSVAVKGGSIPSTPLVMSGLGEVGSAVARLLAENGEELTARLGSHLHLAQVGARRANAKSGLDDALRAEDVFAPIKHPQANILLELMGGTDTAYELTRQAFAAGKNVVTANKALVAEKGEELLQMARAQGVHYLYEAAVAGGIPIIKMLREGLIANRIHRITGIVNGTCNYILSRMQKDSFATSLKQAQDLGYAERDPSFDIDGTDSAHKITILASLAFDMPLAYTKTHKIGIEHLHSQDLHYADQLGYVIKHLAVAEARADQSVSIRVHPALVAKHSPLAQVMGVTNALMVESDPLGLTFFSGPGAGGSATASAVLADVADIVAGGELPKLRRQKEPSFTPFEDLASEFYLHINAPEKQGVMAQLTSILSDEGISIEALHQQEHAMEDKSAVPIIVLTHKTVCRNIMRAISKIERSDASLNRVVHLPVFST